MLSPRNVEILKIIVIEYLETWWVLWSKMLLQKYDLWVSSATVRNDMARLEELELVYQPYNSAWRMPTSKWLRAYVNFLMEQVPEHFLEVENIENKSWVINNIWDFWDKISYELAKSTWEIAFFAVEDKNIMKYSWAWYFLENTHSRLWNSIFSIIKMLDDKSSFIKFIKSFPINSSIDVFIGEENILPFLKDYTIIVKKVYIDWSQAYIGVIWSLKMNYSFNISAVNWIIK